MKHLSSSLACLLVLIVLAGCAGTQEQRIQRADLALGATADAVRVGVSSGYLTDPDQLAAARFGLIAGKDVMGKVHAAHAAGDAMGVDFWLEQFVELMATVPVPTGAK